MIWVIYAAAAAIGGLLVGLIGTGNAMVIMPTLAVVFPQVLPGEHALRLATGTTMATMAVGAIAVSLAQHRAGRIDRALLELAVAPYLVGALAGPWLGRYLPTDVLRVYLAVVIVVVAGFLLASRAPHHRSHRAISDARIEISLVLLAIAVCSSVAGIASGIFLIPYLTRFALPMKTIVGTSTAAAALYSVFGTLGHVSAGWSVPGLPANTLGYVYLPAFAIMGLIVVLTGPLGVRLAHRVADERLKRGFAVFLLAAACAILFLS